MSHGKRGALFGLCAAVFVGIIGFVLLTSDSYAGCAGDCMTCHPVLKGSAEHRSLESCIKCHDPAKNISIVPSNDNGCGDRCFDCHNEWPKDGYHADLDTCKNCHKG
ncbi:hypothetical protein LF845_06320 [Deferribacterales bacterium Es71-Z0220]|uniref:hypothetical protein n=1 Tax=Deferrivibrio essentukiensis TaxID=2880922 RepID=UPI001F6092C6|nr:hypothetical protein [Deferrivibrio essentukiensis]MCB4204571.1 hypothetical protein [Deferrivibrio essentukiensis]